MVYLQRYFLSAFRPIDFYHFRQTEEKLDVYWHAKQLFEQKNGGSIVENSVE